MAGVVVASGLQWTAPSAASQAGRDPGATAIAPPAIVGSFAELAKRLSPSVVNVRVAKIEPAAHPRTPIPEGPMGEFFERFFNQQRQIPWPHLRQGAGSGVIISSDGYILTNNHVVAGARKVTVTLADQRELEANVIGGDPKTDLAVLKIDARDSLPAAVLADSDTLQVGDWVMAIGNPFGLNHTVTSGIVSAKGRVIGAGPYDDFIQTDASINPGNSGGPLFNLSGEVVGINTAIIPQGQGIGFAIPVNTAKPLIPQLVSHGQVTRGYLGVTLQALSPELAKALKAEHVQGALVADVIADGPADRAGIRSGDIITAYNGKAVIQSRDLPALVAGTPVAEKARLSVIRDGRTHQFAVTIGKLPADPASLVPSGSADQEQLGLYLQDNSAELVKRFGLPTGQGVVVVGVEPGSPADEAGIRKGDVILAVNQAPVASLEALKRRVARSPDQAPLLLRVQRQNGKFYLPLEQKG